MTLISHQIVPAGSLHQPMTLQQMESHLAYMRHRYDKALGQFDLLMADRRDKATQLSTAHKDIAIYEQVQALFGKVSEFAREQLRIKITATVTAALQAILERDDISFEIILRTVGGQPAAQWEVQSLYGDTLVAGDPESARGGGVSDIVSLALRLALLELARPKPQGMVMLDEAGKHISREYLPNVAEFLKQYAQRTGRQICLVTHADPLAEVADVSYRVTQVDGISAVSEVGRQ